MLETIKSINDVVNGLVWGVPAMVCIIGVGILMSVRTKFIQFRKFPYAMKATLGKIFKKSEAGQGSITPFQAVCTALAATVGTGIFANMITGDQYLSIILTSSLYKKLYQERGYESKLLSRSVEDSATVVSVLIPWNSCGMTQSTVLKVSTLHYLPYCFFNLLSPLMSIFVAMIGYKIKRTEKVEKA